MKKHSTKQFPLTVRELLKEQKFILDDQVDAQISKILDQNRRYFYFVGERIEKNKKVTRFIKIPANQTKKLLLPFSRQVICAKAISSKEIIPTRKVIESHLDVSTGYPFAIFETLPGDSQKIGFIEEDKGSELLSEKHAQEVMKQLFALHEFDARQLNPSLIETIQVKRYKSDYANFRRQIYWYLNKKVSPQDLPLMSFYQILEKRFGISNIKEIVNHIFLKHQEVMEDGQFKGPTMIHGDMATNNLFVFDNGNVELLDLEWMGLVHHKLLALVYDYGNMRVRSWKNQTFREGLDTELFARLSEEVAQAVYDLSILFNYGSIAGFLENYPAQKFNSRQEMQRRKATEEDLRKLLFKYQ